VLGLANYGGGCIVAGVKQRDDGALDPVGLASLSDKTKVSSALDNFLPDTLLRLIEILDFSYKASEYPTLKDKSFQVLVVEDDPSHLPFVAVRDGTSVRNNAIYTRRGASTVAANHEELQRIVSRRLETGYSSRRELDLRTHLEQLKILFEQISPHRTRYIGSLDQWWGTALIEQLASAYSEQIPNPTYPEENYETFVARAIAQKKRRIEKELDIENIPSPDKP
jgi:hypothetical protein